MKKLCLAAVLLLLAATLAEGQPPARERAAQKPRAEGKATFKSKKLRKERTVGPGSSALSATIAIERFKELPREGSEKTIELMKVGKFVPPHVGDGDLDFDGWGPDVKCSVRLSIRNEKELWVRIAMHAKERTHDWTEADGSGDYKVYEHDKKILGIKSDPYSGVSYTDSDHEDDVFNMPEQELVRVFTFVGDTDGEEAGSRTGVTVEFNPVVIGE